MKKSNPTSPTELETLIFEFEEVTSDLRSLDESDKEERQLVEDSRTKLQELQEQVNAILQGNERARRERLVKLNNLRELLSPILYAGYNPIRFGVNDCMNIGTPVNMTTCEVPLCGIR